MRASQARVLAMFRLYGAMDDTQLIRYQREQAIEAGVKPLSESGTRSRRSELSKPNEERLAELRAEFMRVAREKIPVAPTSQSEIEREAKFADDWARSTLLREGVRSPLWAVTERTLDTGRKATVWEIVPADAYKRWLAQ